MPYSLIRDGNHDQWFVSLSEFKPFSLSGYLGDSNNVCILLFSEIVIVQHPVSVCVPRNYTVTLSVRAVGSGALHYQWFQSDQTEVQGATEADFVFTPQNSQLYVCRVNDKHNNCVFSEWVKVKVSDPGALCLPEAWRGEPHIAVNPLSQTVQLGQSIRLQCTAFGIPAPHYQWYQNGNPLQGKTKETLQIENANKDHEGSYLCAISNVLEEKWTEAAEVTIVLPDKPTAKSLTATDKVALLIGNLNYSHFPNLMAPVMDVHELASLLQQLGFRVVSLLDLTKAEMQAAISKFLQLLNRGVYALFYYAGHGYECSGRNYLVPIDAPQPYRPENCVNVQRVMCSMQAKCTALNVVLLDTCRKWYNQHYAPSQIRSLAPLGNTVYGYATCEDAEAFEVQDGERSSSIFTKYLNRHILRPEKVTRVLERVSEDLGRDPLVTGKQVMEIKHTLKDSRALTDPVRTTGHTGELYLRDMCWMRANELPRRCLVTFSCGAEVELNFSAMFSNVVIVFATVRAMGSRALDCRVSLKTTPVLKDIFSNSSRQDWAHDMASLLLCTVDNPDCTLRLCGLQKLQDPLVITVDLHYTDAERKLRISETRKENIGKPLVARWELHKITHTEAAACREEVPFRSVDQKAAPRHPSYQMPDEGCRPSTRKALNTRQCNATMPTECMDSRRKEPEEDDENDFFKCVQGNSS
ncbi:mucosa-associated lymphoid tissue lymphoma translocation protein 1-like [Arapaima gigas]